ncbi:fibulin-1-like isoform X2 [Syngnathoides biaculeatus]|uniref:fibulin-1-like isoform X2 n=1 Tax=Syngnathoides biaculeatus TaxID=300417 RepID=UPI002ADDDB15|nr:fibulin-1-like isoform X2 [Syngnathoides biaculeatus]
MALFLFLVMCEFARGSAFLWYNDSSHPHTFYGCCEDGKERARLLQNCDDLPYISHSHVCRLAQEQCCTAVVEGRLCDSGASMARTQEACESYFFPGDPWENKIAKSCCDCCMLGMASEEQDPTCEMTYLSLGKVCKDVAKNCCANNFTEVFNSTEEVFTVNTGSPTVPPESLFSTSTIVPLVAASNCTALNCSQHCVEDGICACDVGYRLQHDGTTCEDINECLLNVHNCVTGQICINTKGSFRCQRETGCGTGYELTDNNGCQDIDECALNIHNCELNFECTNTEGSFHCHPKETCAGGFIQDAVGNCIDINECAAHPAPCQPGHTCVNTHGSFICRRSTITCGRGYHLDAEGTRCEDVDECQTGSVCRNHGCVNMVGTYRCVCNIGFIFNSVARLCEDIDECRYYPRRLCAHKCVNTEGSYECSCSTGFQLAPDGRNCQDVNECDDNPCSQECTNVYGSYQCYCHRGYQLSDTDGVTCEDIDECAVPTDSQVCAYQCFNAPGSFYCACPTAGYALASNGRTCQDIDECAAGSHSCGANQACFNIRGGYRCLVFGCPSYYRQGAHGSVNKDSVSVRCHKACHPNNLACMHNSVQIITYTVLSLPTYRQLNQPEDIVFLRTSMPAQPPNSNIDLVFEMLKTDNQFSFDVVKRYFQGYVIGVVRQVRPVAGPQDIELLVALNYIKSGYVSHRNIVSIYAVVSQFWF